MVSRRRSTLNLGPKEQDGTRISARKAPSKFGVSAAIKIPVQDPTSEPQTDEDAAALSPVPATRLETAVTTISANSKPASGLATSGNKTTATAKLADPPTKTRSRAKDSTAQNAPTEGQSPPLL